MKYLLGLILTFFITLNFTSLAKTDSEDIIAIINIDYVIQNSNIGKKFLSNIKSQDQKNLDNLKNKNIFLQELESSIKKKKNIISSEAYDKEVLEFNKKFQEFSNEKNQIVKEFNDFKQKELENLFKIINPIINDYMEQNSVKILFDSKNIFMSVNELNLTEDILKKINDELN
jgi:Skp family chaperone for outer membrane proteins